MTGAEWEGVGRWAVPAVVALALDAAVGDPPGRWHPVAWMGAAIAGGRRLAASRGRLASFLAGVMIAAGGAAVCVAIGVLVSLGCHAAPPPVGWVLEGVVLKATLAARGLAAAAGEVRAALEAGDLPGSRRLLTWHLVSRDTDGLSAAQVAAAAVESVAENASDGVVAPLFWFAVGGLPAALVYRFVNTADAMLGYRDPAREWLGKFPARLDDVLNLLPARLTAAVMLVVGRSRAAVWVWWRDCRRTASPNAGHPMAAAAGVLGVELEKVGAYTLGTGQRPPSPADVRRAVRLLWGVTAATGFLLLVVAVVRGVVG